MMSRVRQLTLVWTKKQKNIRLSTGWVGWTMSHDVQEFKAKWSRSTNFYTVPINQ